MANATITRLPDYYRPWVWSLKVTSIEQDIFHELIESLKSNINHRKRKWDPTGKRWLFHDDALVKAGHSTEAMDRNVAEHVFGGAK